MMHRNVVRPLKIHTNKEFHTNFNIKQLKPRKEIFEDLKDKLKQAIKNTDSLNLDENESPYTNMNKVIKHILE